MNEAREHLILRSWEGAASNYTLDCLHDPSISALFYQFSWTREQRRTALTCLPYSPIMISV